MKVKEVIKLIEKDGWYLKETKVSHRQLPTSISDSVEVAA